MRGAQNGGSHKVTFCFSLAAVAPLGIKIGTMCIGACCVEYYILDIFAKQCEGCSCQSKAASQPIICIQRMWPYCVLVDIAVTLASTWMRKRKHALVLLSGTHVESGESRSIHDEDLVADGIR